jgi:hypothetical protein
MKEDTMSDKLSPEEALERLFEVIRQEAAASPKFARRMLDAINAPITFSGSDAGDAADPIILAGRSENVQAYLEKLITFSEPELKKMIKAHGLGTAEDVKNAVRAGGGHRKHKLIELMWTRARRRIDERH